MLNIKEYIEDKGIDVVREDGVELACYCPFHANRDTPAFYINRTTGLWICFNPGCGKRGSIKDLMVFFGDNPSFKKETTISELEEMLLEKQKDHVDETWDETLDKIRVVFPGEASKVQYLLNRGFTESTLEYFEVGFSEKKQRIVIPARDEHFKIIGFIGRATNPNYQPKYMYSKGFPRKDILFNLNNAKQFGSVIVVEGSLDAIKIHQAGYKNVVATLGAMVSKEHCELLRSYFDTIIIFSDNDHAGFVMRDSLISSCSHMDIKIVKYPSLDIKDPGDMNEDQIAECISGAVNHLAWSLDL